MNAQWMARKVVTVVGFYLAAAIVTAVIYVLLHDRLTKGQLYIASIVAIAIAVVPLFVWLHRALAVRPNRYGRDVE